MSDDESAASSSSEDLAQTGLVATRAKRQTAGNLYSTLRANLDDEELQKELLAEDELEDAEDYQASDRDDDDAAMESSSSDEDAGPAAAEDLEGEREIKRAERAEVKKRKRVQGGRMRIPGMAPPAKRVRIDEGVKTEIGGSEAVERLKKKKKSERSNWLPSGADAPTRQSSRGLAVANREVVHKNLVESAARSERQKQLMKDAAKRARATDRANLTQEERLEKCRKIERETAKELGRFEREEAERVRAREEALAAKRKKGLDGPVQKIWSGSGVWERPDDGLSPWDLKVARMGGRSMKDYEIEAERKKEEMRLEEKRKAEEFARKEAEKAEAARVEAERLEALRIEAEQAEIARKEAEKAAMDVVNWSGDASDPMDVSPQQAKQPSDAWLSGIHEYAAQSEAPLATPSLPYTPSAPALNTTAVIQPTASADDTETPKFPLEVASLIESVQPTPAQPVNTVPLPPKTFHTNTVKGWPPGSTSFASTPQAVPSSQPDPVPAGPPTRVLRTQAERTLIILENYPDLEATASTSTKSRAKSSTTNPAPSTTEPTPLASTILSDSYPPLTPAQKAYLAPPTKKGTKAKGLPLDTTLPLPDRPPKSRCCITGWPAKYSDPKTGLPYADVQTYKIIQRVMAGGCAWSAVLGVGVWVGPRYGKLGRPARGVPEGFASAGAEGGVKKEIQA